ncbi:hypothetical protein [Sphingobium sp. LSP13-1-1.1]|uniref:hypothetical protein n=1 Tax=Sphingobium sp. LSP13-1-1.1 TaxID=3135234 RepID=UPI00341DB57A
MRNIRGEGEPLRLDGNDPEYGSPTHPIQIEGVTYLPATDLSFTVPVDNHGHKHGMVLMRMGIMGMNAAMAPAGPRAFANEMIRAAEEIEADAKMKAGEALARATGKSRT